MNDEPLGGSWEIGRCLRWEFDKRGDSAEIWAVHPCHAPVHNTPSKPRYERIRCDNGHTNPTWEEVPKMEEKDDALEAAVGWQKAAEEEATKQGLQRNEARAERDAAVELLRKARKAMHDVDDTGFVHKTRAGKVMRAVADQITAALEKADRGEPMRGPQPELVDVLAARLRSFMGRRNLTQMQMAELAGVSQAVISRLLRGRLMKVRQETSDRLTGIMGLRAMTTEEVQAGIIREHQAEVERRGKLLEQAAKLLLQAGGLHDAHSGGTVIGTRDLYTETLQARGDCYTLGHQINDALEKDDE